MLRQRHGSDDDGDDARAFLESREGESVSAAFEDFVKEAQDERQTPGISILELSMAPPWCATPTVATSMCGHCAAGARQRLGRGGHRFERTD